MARKRKTTEPAETGVQEALQQARTQLDTSIETKNAGAVGKGIEECLSTILIVHVPQITIFQNNLFLPFQLSFLSQITPVQTISL